MSNSTRIAERQRTDTSSPMPVDAVRDLLAVVRALEARVAVLEDLLASAITPPAAKSRPGARMIAALKDAIAFAEGDETKGRLIYPSDTTPTVPDAAWAVTAPPSDALSAALRLPTVPDAYGR